MSQANVQDEDELPFDSGGDSEVRFREDIDFDEVDEYEESEDESEA
jgi:hypothetical protein